MQQDYAEQYARLYRRHWWWRSREHAVVQTIRGLTELPDDAAILDVGCGDALSLPVLSSLTPRAQAWGIEIDHHTIDPDNPLRDRIYDKPLGDAMYRSMRFDLITALDVIEHIEDDRGAVAAMMQMLRPGGWLVITVPALPALWTTHDDINKHYRRYTRSTLTRLLQPHGELRDCRYFYAALTLPKLMVAWLEKLRPPQPKPAGLPPATINRMAQAYFNAELALARRVRLPVGSSLIAAVHKPVDAAETAPVNTPGHANADTAHPQRLAG